MKWLALSLLMMPGLAAAHSGHTSTQMWDACDDAVHGEICSFVTEGHARHTGTCQVLADDLMCVRNRPIEQLDEAPETVVTDSPAGRSAWTSVALGGVPLVGLTVFGLVVFGRGRRE
jgi:hypothetical protein